MADITLQKVGLTGVNPTFTAASAGGDKFLNDGNVILHVKNGGASPITVTVDSVAKCNHGFDHDAVVSVAAGVTMQIGPFPSSRFNDITGKASVTYSGVTTVTVAAVTTK